MRTKAFTLIELAVVLLVIGILAGIVLRNIGSQGIQARDIKRVSDLRNMTIYIAQYMSKKGEFPSVSDIKWHSANSSLSKALQDAKILSQGISLPAPKTGGSYEYYACSDQDKAPPDGFTNHFILRTQLEQLKSENAQLYEGVYNKSVLPEGWNCAIPE
jgi:prepilin-type N-terminal cleavage/methylation domain-containing protein